MVFKAKGITLFYFAPCDGYFKIFLTYGKNAEKEMKQSYIPEHVKEAISTAIDYAEGKTFFIDVKDESDLESVFTLLRIKHES